ncbi:unnamed protein product [Oppiella nova]|uniref:Nuclear receptor domain-containing protein n=1 Tax=Oppiella nova TaxID=334625 RepID=A0A7R9QSV5_9ACAR|nr:unnamed protein product [Oppiella nova]CAG2173696.1 unnamed protein product [Oppiella nova]
MSDKQNDKFCDICGDKASGRHFGAISCLSCKQFFKRTAPTNKNILCIHKELILTTDEKQRLRRGNKSNEEGMRKELILTTGEKQRLRRENKSNEDIMTDINKSYLDFSEIESSDQFVTENEDFLNKIFDNNVTTDDLTAEIHEIETYLQQNNDNSEDITKTRPQESAIVPLFHQIIKSKDFNELEIHRMSELLSAANVFISDPIHPFISEEITDLYQLMACVPHMVDTENRAIVRFSSQLSLQDSLLCKDLTILVNYGSNDLRLLRSILYFNFDNNYWSVKMRLKILFTNINSEWDKDPAIIDLMTAICL